MKKRNVRILLDFLDRSRKKIRYYKNKINTDIKFARDLDYNFFAFTQLIYALFEYLRKNYVSNKGDIEKFFKPKRNMTATRNIFMLANKWKHEKGSIKLHDIIDMKVTINDNENISTTNTRRRGISHSDNSMNDICKLVDLCYKEVKDYIEKNEF